MSPSFTQWNSSTKPNPRKGATTNRHAFIYAVGSSNFKPRSSCNAAVALFFLRSRRNHRPTDRLDITSEFTSLATCLFALAFISGDMSLLISEAYPTSLVRSFISVPSYALDFHAPNAGAQLAAYVFSVDRAIDLSYIRDKWRMRWEK